jgi:hypothetical protein
MKDYVADQIVKRRAELDALVRRHEIVETELDALVRRREIVEAELRLLEEVQRVAEADSQPRHMMKRTSTSDGRNHLHPQWQSVVTEAVKRYPAPIRNDEVPEIQRTAGKEPSSPQAVRTHVSTQAQAGRYEKLGRGVFRATRLGAELAGLVLPEPAEDSPKGEPGLGPAPA